MSESCPIEYDIPKTQILGLRIIKLMMNAEKYLQEKIESRELPDDEKIHSHISFMKKIGVTKGLQAEPWEKFISVTGGSIFGVWIDLRLGKTFGQKLTAKIDPGMAIIIPHGVASGFQTQDPHVTYSSYTIKKNILAETNHIFIDPFDEELAINWPIPQNQAIISTEDRSYLKFSELKSKLSEK